MVRGGLGQLPLYGRRRQELRDFFSTLANMFRRERVDGDHDRHPVQLWVLGRTDRKRVDVALPPRKQRRNPSQRTGFVLDQDR